MGSCSQTLRTISMPVMSLWPLPQYSEQRIGKLPSVVGSEVDGHRFPAARDLLFDFQLLDFQAMDAVGRPHDQLQALADGRLDFRRLEGEAARRDFNDPRFRRLRRRTD